MQILINGNNSVVWRYGQTLPLGLLLNPGGGTTVAQAGAWCRPWALDNGAFGKTPEWMFWRAVGEIRRTPDARTFLLFVVPPDVPFDARGTIGLFWYNLAWLADADEAFDLPLAVVGQDGMEDCDWDWFFGFADCFFIGGTTDWKLSRTAADLAREAKSRGLHVHMGRVNSVKRLAYAMSIGCDSVDGTGLTKFADAHLPRIKRRLFPGYVDMPEWIDPRLLEQHCCSEVAVSRERVDCKFVPVVPVGDYKPTNRINVTVNYDKSRKIAYLSVYPCHVGDGMMSTALMSGRLIEIEPMPRLNAKRLEALAVAANSQIAAKDGFAWDQVLKVVEKEGLTLEGEPEAERVTLYTDAHVDYDGFSTRTEEVVGTSNKGEGREVRRISILPRDYEWQTGRYGSGMCRYTHERMKLEDYVRFGDWTLTPEPPIDVDEFAALNKALGLDLGGDE